MDEARQFIHVRFDERMWKEFTQSGYKVFVIYAWGEGVRETSTKTLFIDIEQARWQVNQIREDGIVDAEDGEIKPDDILRIEIRKRVRSRFDID